jgi:hypothetical protein
MHDVKESGLERKGFVFDEQYPLSSLCYYPLTVLGDFCSPDFVWGTQPSRSHGSLSSSSDSQLYAAVGEEEADFFISRDSTIADEAP